MTVGVKYCGGCNPRYDRTAFVARLAAACPGAAFAGVRPGERCDKLLVVCGCTARCANHSAIESRDGTLVVFSESAFDEALDFLTKGTETTCLLP